MENNCQDKAHEYEPCDSSFVESPHTVNGLVIPNNELQKFKELYRDYDYTLIKHDDEHYFAYDFISFKQKQSKILSQGIAEINAVKPIYLLSDYSQKSKHQKPAAQKQNEIEKRRAKNKNSRKTHRK
jgi:hypothetical protein